MLIRKIPQKIKQLLIITSILLIPFQTFAADVPVNKPQEKTTAKKPVPETTLHFSLRAGVGYFKGELKEEVYSSRVDRRRLSQLTWDIDSVVMGNIGMSCNYKDWLTLNIDSWLKITDGSGSMDNYDWMLIDANWSDWSYSDTDVSSASIFDANLDMIFFQNPTYKLSGIIGIKRDHFETVASGGHYIYSRDGFRNTIGVFPDVRGISYEQTMTAPYLGMGLSAELTSTITLSGRFIYSPFVDGKATDHHYLRNLVVEDEVTSSDMSAFDLSVGWKFFENLIWNINIGYQKYNTATGDSSYYYYNTGESKRFENSSGMGQQLTRFSTSLTYLF